MIKKSVIIVNKMCSFKILLLFPLQTSGLYEYKVYGILDDVLPDVCAQVYMDLEYRKKWDSYVNGNNCTFQKKK